jgi:hypothetical protein
MQELFKKDMSKAAKLVLDGTVTATVPTMEEMVDYWSPILTEPSLPIEQEEGPAVQNNNLLMIANPVSCEEILSNEVPLGSSPGLDNISSRQWRSVPVVLRALYYNIIILVGGFSEDQLMSRTVFVPKKDGSSSPSEFRPISVASVVVRQLHKVFASRLLKANLIDERQRGLRDGCAENVIVLSAALKDAKVNLKQLHVYSLDVAKAFDSVSRYGVRSTLRSLGLPESFVGYVDSTYAKSSTVLEVRGDRSRPILVSRGVRQSDTLSSLIFAMVVDRVLSTLPSEIGYCIGSLSNNALAYGDDIVLIAASSLGMQKLLRSAEEEAGKYGLVFNPSKCMAMSILVDGKNKKYKISTEPRFKINGGVI